jgi:drug/metabolite transporter (DMT)-like permease
VPPETLYGLVLAAAVAHATWNALLKSSSDPMLMLAAIRAVGLIFGLSLLPFVSLPPPEVWPWLLACAFAHYAYYALLLRCYRHGDMSLVYPLARGAAPLLLAAIAYLAIGEALNHWQMVAVALTSSGIMLLAFGKGRNGVAAAFGLATAASVASYSFLGGVGVRLNGSVWGFQACLEILTSLPILAFAGIRRGKAVAAFARSQWPKGLFAGAISTAGYLTYQLAVTVLPLAPVAALRESSALFGAVIGTLVFKEGFGATRLIAAGLVTSGIVLLGLMSF